jgi:3-dehydroquinate dehydratase II
MMKHMSLRLVLFIVAWSANVGGSHASIASISSLLSVQSAAAAAPLGTASTTVQTRVTKRFKILLVQGANLSYLGRREPELYGTTSAAELDSMLRAYAEKRGYDLEIYYTHIEGEAITRLYRAADEHFDGVVMNPGGFTYAGYALRDCLRTLPFPYVEVHMTNLDKRGIRSVIAEVAVGVISGFGTETYILGLDAMINHLSEMHEQHR